MPDSPQDVREPSAPGAHADTHSSPQAAAPAAGKSGAAPKGAVPHAELTAAVAAVIGGGLVGLVLLLGRGDAPADASHTPVEAAGLIPSSAHSVPSAPGRWSSGSHSRWKSARSKDLVLELPADNKVAVWMKHVRPMLVVRCMNRRPEVFVFTESAAAIETQDENHTVRVAFDGEPATMERWPDSVEHDALFAPDGDAFLRKLARARTMTFAFSPHNAMPVEAQFNVSGLDRLIDPAAKVCGWK